MTPFWLRWPTTNRAVALVGLAGVSAAWVVVWSLSARQLTEIRRATLAAEQELLDSTAAVSAIREHALTASVVVRDLQFDTDPAARRTYHSILEQIRRASAETLALLADHRTGVEGSRALEALRAEMDAFWTAVLGNVERHEALRAPSAADIRREGVLRMTTEFETLHRQALEAHRLELTSLYEGSYRRLLLLGGGALLLTVVIGFASARQLARLERVIDAQRQEDARKERELRRLSAQVMSAHDHERRLLARDLHDDVGQAIAAVELELADLQRRLNAGEAPSHALDAARTMLRATLARTRELSRLVHPALLDELGLTAAVERYVESLTGRVETRLSVRSAIGEERFASELETCAYRFAQEALTNAIRHARASRCVVTISREDDTLSVSVEDNGVGFEPLTARIGSNGLGLLSIRERVHALRGTFVIDAHPGAGSRLEVRLPSMPGQGSEPGTPRSPNFLRAVSGAGQ